MDGLTSIASIGGAGKHFDGKSKPDITAAAERLIHSALCGPIRLRTMLITLQRDPSKDRSAEHAGTTVRPWHSWFDQPNGRQAGCQTEQRYQSIVKARRPAFVDVKCTIATSKPLAMPMLKPSLSLRRMPVKPTGRIVIVTLKSMKIPTRSGCSASSCIDTGFPLPWTTSVRSGAR